MRIDVIDDDAGFASVRENWDQVYMRDPHAQHFLSWSWLKSYLSRRARWFVLALRESEPGSPYTAFFPLRLSTYQDRKTGAFSDEITMAGNFAADYTGFLSEPEYEEHAARGFAAFLKSQHWTNLRLDNFTGSPKRREAMLSAFRSEEFVLRKRPTTGDNGIDNCICPYVPLPESWEDYLEQQVSSQTRQKFRRLLRKLDGDEGYRVNYATHATIDRDLDALFVLWRTRWSEQKGEDRTNRLVAATRQMLMDSFDEGNLDVPVLWCGDRPLGVLANIIDRPKKTILFYITGRDETFKALSPGLLLHAYAIRHAISEGIRSYDFMRGNEPYKYLFGAEDRTISCPIVRTRTGRNLGGVLHPLSIRHVYEQGTELYKKGSKKEAEIAFQQVCETVPDHMGARFGLAQLLFDQSRLTEAEAEFKKIAEKVDDRVPVLIRLGDTQIALRRFDAAAETFARVTKLAPDNSQAHYKRGVALVAAKRLAKAAKAFAALQEFHSDDPTHASYLAKAQAALAQISSANAAHRPASDPTPSPVAALAGIKTAGRKKLRHSTAIRQPELPLVR